MACWRAFDRLRRSTFNRLACGEKGDDEDVDSHGIVDEMNEVLNRFMDGG